MDYLCTADRSLALDRFYRRLHFQVLKSGHFSILYDGHWSAPELLQLIQNYLRKLTVKVYNPPTVLHNAEVCVPPSLDSKNGYCIHTSAHSASLSCHCTSTINATGSSVPLTKEGSFCHVPNVRGPPNSVALVQIRFHSSVTFQSSFFKGFVSLYFRLKSVCFCSAFYDADANFRIILQGYCAVH